MTERPSIWLYHPKPQDDELLSSWLVRLAHGHGMKLQTFCRVSLGKGQDLWNRDIDRQAPEWLIRSLSSHTGIGLREIRNTSLLAYKGILYRHYRWSGHQYWLLPLKMYCVKRLHYGMQYCPQCIAEDNEPYFRKRWRVSFYTMCTKHQCMVHDRCPSCGAPVAFHRREMGRFSIIDGGSLALCHVCNFDLRKSQRRPVVIYDKSAYQAWFPVLKLVEGDNCVYQQCDMGYLAVAHQLCKIMLTHYQHAYLRQYVSEIIEAPDIQLGKNYEPFERYGVDDRHTVMQLAMWLMADPSLRIVDAWRNRAIRFNLLKKDLEQVPPWFREVIMKTSNWHMSNRKMNRPGF